MESKGGDDGKDEEGATPPRVDEVCAAPTVPTVQMLPSQVWSMILLEVAARELAHVDRTRPCGGEVKALLRLGGGVGAVEMD